MNLEKLNQIAEETNKKREGKVMVCVCAGAGCISSGAQPTLDAFKKIIKEKNLSSTVEAIPVGCMGACNQGPLVSVGSDETIYQKVTPEQTSEIIEKKLENKGPISKMLLFSDLPGKTVTKSSDLPFFNKQKKIVLENCGRISPENIDDYIAVGGYKALHKALTEMSREEVVAEIKQSGLRGRGGAGYPTGLKWEMVYKYVNDIKYVVCNGDEGDPGAFMDRSVLEGDPHRILEGMALAGYAVGAIKGYIYVRAEYPLAIKRLEAAIKQARALGLKTMLHLRCYFDRAFLLRHPYATYKHVREVCVGPGGDRLARSFRCLRPGARRPCDQHSSALATSV